jgi:aldehyde dehydrogenase
MTYKKPDFKNQYGNFINGKWVAPVDGEYFNDYSPIDGTLVTQIPRSNEKDIDMAVKAGWEAHPAWSATSVTERSNILLNIANTIEKNLEHLALVETWDNGKPIRESLAADIPLTVDHFRYFAGVIRAEEGSISSPAPNTVSMEIHESLGVVGQIIPWNFPILMAAWKLAPAIAAGNCVVIKPAEQTPVSILVLMEIISHLLPAGVVNIVNGFGPEAGKPLACHKDIRKIAFTGETTTGRLILQYASENLISSTLELGGKSPNIFLESIMDEDDAFLDKAVEGAVMFALNNGEVCTCPSRALIQESIYEEFISRVLKRVEAIKVGDPLDPNSMMGSQASSDQYEKILNYINIGKEEGAELLIGGDAMKNPQYPNGYYINPTVFKGHNKMRIFQEEIFGPVLGVTTFKDEAEALEIANDTLYGLGAAAWTRDIHQMQNFVTGIEAGRIWCNCYHLYPAHSSFGGFKKSGIGRETHKMMLNHYRHTKNVIVDYNRDKAGLF